MHHRHLVLGGAVALACIVAAPADAAGGGATTPQAMYAEGNAALDRNDFAKAFPLLKKAAEAGLPMAMTRLGLCYASGWGTKADMKLGAQWYGKGAAADDRHGQFMLAQCFRAGAGVPKDAQRAYKLMRAAADQELGPACLALGAMYEAGEGTKADIVKSAVYYALAAGADVAEGNARLAKLGPKMTPAQGDQVRAEITAWAKAHKKK